LFLLAVTVAACGSSSPRAKAVPLKPSRILAAPAGLMAGGGPQTDGTMWLIAGLVNAKTLQQINLVTDKVEQIVPIGLDADSLVESSTEILAIGYSTGSVEFRNGSSGALLSTTTVGAPVKAIAVGSNGTTFFVLNGTSTSTSVTELSANGAAEPPSIGVSLGTIALAVATNGGKLYLLQSSGSVIDVPLSVTGAESSASATFFVGPAPVQMALSGDGSTLFVLKGTGTNMNVSVVDVGTERQTGVLPAPANSVGVLASLDSSDIYVLVGTQTAGNIQVFPVGQ
jgi:hypothetical protein